MIDSVCVSERERAGRTGERGEGGERRDGATERECVCQGRWYRSGGGGESASVVEAGDADYDALFSCTPYFNPIAAPYTLNPDCRRNRSRSSLETQAAAATLGGKAVDTYASLMSDTEILPS